MSKYWAKPALLGLALVALSGCVTYPIAKNLQRQARPLTLSQVVRNPDATKGTVVIWGGRIIKTVNDVNGSALYILMLPLDSSGKPVWYADSPGRFIASSKDFLDPEVYKNGRLVTVAGPIAGLETHPVQKSKYTYAVMDSQQIHLWPREPRYYYNSYPNYYPYYPGWYWGWGWYPGWSWGWYYGGDGDWDRGYHYHGGDWDRDSGHWGGSYHYQGGGHWNGGYHH